MNLNQIKSLEDLVAIYGRSYEIMDLGYKAYLWPTQPGRKGKRKVLPRMFRLEDGRVWTSSYANTKEDLEAMYEPSVFAPINLEYLMVAPRAAEKEILRKSR